MGAGERAPTKARVTRQRSLLNQLANRTEPPVLKLAHIEVSLRCDVLRPSQKEVACRLHDALTFDHALDLVPLEFRRQPLENGFAGFLDLQEQRRAVATHVQPDGAERANAADTDDLEGDVLERISIDETKPVR